MNIMVCFDGSNVASHALDLAKKRAGRLGGKIYLVTSMPSGLEMDKKDFEKAEKQLEKAKLSVVKENIDCETLLSVNQLSTGENLVQVAEEKAISEIYIGVRKRSKVGKLVFGSTAQYVILSAPCPVITVK